jgi:hypothetical protein
VRKALVCIGLVLAFMAAPASAAVNLGLPIDTDVNFDGNGVFDSSLAGGFDASGPLPFPQGAELFGTGTISGVAAIAQPGTPLWEPSDVGPTFEMTFVFWDAVVVTSSRTFINLDADATLEILLAATYTDGARVLLVQDSSDDFDSSPGPSGFDLDDGEYATAYTLEDAGYDSDAAPDAGSDFVIADDAGEEVFLDLLLDGNQSQLIWDPDTASFTIGTFTSTAVEILGGGGASQFSDYIGPDGEAAALILTFSPTGWAFGGDIDIQLTTVPEPATLVFLGTGLVSLLGYGIRRKMS